MLQRGPRNCCLALALLATAGVAQAASFDCDKSTTEIERATRRGQQQSQLYGPCVTARRERLVQTTGAAAE
jgi:hypothetical protein